MGQLESEFQFTGRLGNVTAYRMRGVDKIIVRKKGGPSKERILTERCFVRTRENNAEFSGRARGVHCVRVALAPIRLFSDYNYVGNINKVLKYVQDRDVEHKRGERRILFSQHGTLLEGFSLNRYATFDNLIRTPLMWDFSMDTLTAKVKIPELLPEINFFPPQKHAFFKVTVALGIVPDLFITDSKYGPTNEKYESICTGVGSSTSWMPTKKELPAATLEVKLPSAPPDDACAFILSIGVAYGAPDVEGITRVRHAGCARILSVVGKTSREADK